MSVEDFQQRLTECDRATLEYHYIFSDALEHQQSLIELCLFVVYE
ncbi:hypothetical protein [Leptolyngbya sp. FACHB-8]|nr:hypothetical protein [Leptolyngbya sp. FACHB-8]